MKNKIIIFALLLFLVADTILSFSHQYNYPLDGDFPNIVLPDPVFDAVLSDPFGTKALLHGEIYQAPNRYFAHQSMITYFKTVPFYLQYFFSPLDSIYIACAIIKTLAQLVLIYVLSYLITGTFNLLNKSFLLTAALITTLFQSGGFQETMGIINPSITYFFFYSLPLAFLFILIIPFYRYFFNGQAISYNYASVTLWIILAIYISLNGPLIPAVILISLPLLFYNILRKKITSDRKVNAFLVFLFILSLYSFYIGRFNWENFVTLLPLKERFLRLPIGLGKLFIEKQLLGLPLLTVFTLFNFIWITLFYTNAETKKISSLIKWIGLFILIYTIMLPFGGYRPYRFYIVRSDTYMPVILLIVFSFGLSSTYLLKQLSGKTSKIFGTALIILGFIMANADLKTKSESKYERAAIEKIACSPKNIVKLDDWCSIWAWNKRDTPEDSKNTAELLYYLRITSTLKLFYQE